LLNFILAILKIGSTWSRQLLRLVNNNFDKNFDLFKVKPMSYKKKLEGFSNYDNVLHDSIRTSMFFLMFSFPFNLNFSLTYLFLAHLNLVATSIFLDLSSYILKLVDLLFLASSRLCYVTLRSLVKGKALFNICELISFFGYFLICLIVHQEAYWFKV
jgi:hypothetical protein